jgi:polygalacturonase
MARCKIVLFVGLTLAGFLTAQVNAETFDVKKYGAVGDGKTIDTPTVNKAIEAAAAVGGGTVYFPAGTYACFSIRLKSNISLHLDQGATILAASPGEQGGYDPAEENEWGDKLKYQDFGHSHWHNSLIWGENLQNISIFGPGMIPSMFGKMPAYGFFIRHAKSLQMDNVEVSFIKDDLRPAFVLNDVKGAEFNNVKAQTVAEVPTFVLKNVESFATRQCKPVADTKLDRVEEKSL